MQLKRAWLVHADQPRLLNTLVSRTGFHVLKYRTSHQGNKLLGTRKQQKKILNRVRLFLIIFVDANDRKHGKGHSQNRHSRKRLWLTCLTFCIAHLRMTAGATVKTRSELLTLYLYLRSHRLKHLTRHSSSGSRTHQVLQVTSQSNPPTSWCRGEHRARLCGGFATHTAALYHRHRQDQHFSPGEFEPFWFRPT